MLFRSQHNASRVVLKINDQVVGDTTADADRATLTYGLSGDGEFDVVALCYNEHAEAHSCALTIKKDNVLVFD